MWSTSIAALLICIPINVLQNSISVVVETYRHLHPGRSADGVAYISGEPLSLGTGEISGGETHPYKLLTMKRSEEGLKALGAKTQYKTDYAPEVLETFVNKHPDNDYWVRFNCPEFTSLCPITGQPDFAEIRISYLPDVKMVESKSLKLYLFSFRNHGDFHEDCVNKIMKDLISLMDPKYIEVTGIFTPRGGISIYPYANYGRPGTKYEKMAEFRMLHHDM